MDCDINFLQELITYNHHTFESSWSSNSSFCKSLFSSWNTCIGTGTLWHNFKNTIILYVMWESIILILPQLLSVVVGRCSSVLGISGYCYVMNFNSQVLHWGVEQITVFEEMTADVLLIRTIPADIFTPLPSSLMLARHTFS